ncbi:hypothetical protein [Limobrevibacterium gyesilva]|uniref:Uncharacterized protein n=1 Tax=Limobrevibacterium gyesilva TaxID=2991712 RepID=A0AA41YJU5_9PROT|nr:hypothetical protein [Limobrevibacterium gyesilva]MCW3473437.1 hypothetical protein [Limobrevibacterium gyesilva]
MAKSTETAENPKVPNEEKPSSAGPDLFAFTIDASTGQITRLEKVESTGARRQLSEQDKASLQASKSSHTLEAIVEQAFEAGIACALGNGDETDEVPESEDEAEVRRTLLLPLMERSRTTALLQRSVLGQAILATALQQVTAPHASEAEGGSAQQTSGAAAKPRQSGPAGPAQD